MSVTIVKNRVLFAVMLVLLVTLSTAALAQDTHSKVVSSPVIPGRAQARSESQAPPE